MSPSGPGGGEPALGVHPQTVRYRVRQLRELFGVQEPFGALQEFRAAFFSAAILFASGLKRIELALLVGRQVELRINLRAFHLARLVGTAHFVTRER